VEEKSTLLGGEVHVRATGERHRLKKGENLQFSALNGSLTGLRLGPDGIRFAFQGRVSDLKHAAPGLPPENLMPSILDRWIAGSAQRAVQAAAGILAILILLLTALNPWPHTKEIV